MIEQTLKLYAKNLEEGIEHLFESDNSAYEIVREACRYSLLLGGKRIRPFLLNRFYKLCGGKYNSCVHFEVAIECIHTYSLIHDDLPCMDNDDMRRGQPSCHKKFGESFALLAGDALLTDAFSIASYTNDIDSKVVIMALRELADCAGVSGMIGGQTIDLLYEDKSADIDVLNQICSLKTGALIGGACKIGCILAGATEQEIAAADNYAKYLGLAFQIVDDILDEVGSEEKLGKPIHSDKANNKSTFVSLLGIEKCRELVNELTEKAKSELDIFDKDTQELKQFADFLCARDY